MNGQGGSFTAVEPTANVEALHDEVASLRALVGPDEPSYEQLRNDRDAAVGAAREAEREVGRVRGELAEMHVQLIRARQDQERYQQIFDRARRISERATAVAGRFRRALRR